MWAWVKEVGVMGLVVGARRSRMSLGLVIPALRRVIMGCGLGGVVVVVVVLGEEVMEEGVGIVGGGRGD